MSLANIYSLTDQTMRALASFNRGLRALDIRGCWRITDRGLSLVAEYCHHLTVLGVMECRDVTERSLCRLRQRGVRVDRPLNPYFVSIGEDSRQSHQMLRLQV